MTISSLEGILRAAQGSIIGYITFVVLLFIASIFADRIVAMLDGEEKAALAKFKKWLFWVIFLIGTVVFAFSLAVTTAANRLPHNDADGSGVYSQMDSNTDSSSTAKQ